MLQAYGYSEYRQETLLTFRGSFRSMIVVCYNRCEASKVLIPIHLTDDGKFSNKGHCIYKH